MPKEIRLEDCQLFVDEAGNLLYEVVPVSESLLAAVGGVELRSSQSAGDESYVPSSPPASEEVGSSQESDASGERPPVRMDMATLRQKCQWGAPRGTKRSEEHEDGIGLCKRVLGRVPFTVSGWCKLAAMKPSKEDGYIQLSWDGVNKFAVLGEVVVWSKGLQKDAEYKLGKSTQDVSHLCNQTRCMNPDHVIIESRADNNSRKGCTAWIQCGPRCRDCDGQRLLLLCTHTPRCVTYHGDYTSQEDLLSRGICSDESGQVRQQKARRLEDSRAGLPRHSGGGSGSISPSTSRGRSSRRSSGQTS